MRGSDQFRRSFELEVTIESDDLVADIDASDMEGVVEDPGTIFICEVTEG